LENALTELPDQAVRHDAIGYYTDVDLPFYYSLATSFAISDRYFASVLGQTFPNRAYLAAATSFGHLTPRKSSAASPGVAISRSPGRSTT